MIEAHINHLIQYGLNHHLIDPEDLSYIKHKLCMIFKYDDISLDHVDNFDINQTLKALANHLYHENSGYTIETYQSFLMDCILPSPYEINRKFKSFYKKSPKQALDFLHRFSLNSKQIINDFDEHLIEKVSADDDLPMIHLRLNNELTFVSNQKGLVTNKEYFDLHEIYCDLFLGNQLHYRKVDVGIYNQKDQWELVFLPMPIIQRHMLLQKKNRELTYLNHHTIEEMIDFLNKFPQCSIAYKGLTLFNHTFDIGQYDYPIEKSEIIRKYKYQKMVIEVLNWPIPSFRISGNNENRIIDLSVDILHVIEKYQSDQVDEKLLQVALYAKLDGSNFNLYMLLFNQKQMHSIDDVDFYHLLGLGKVHSKKSNEFKEKSVEDLIIEGKDYIKALESLKPFGNLNEFLELIEKAI